MSGSAMSDWAASNQSLQLTMQIANALDCPLGDREEDDTLLDCLRQRRWVNQFTELLSGANGCLSVALCPF